MQLISRLWILISCLFAAPLATAALKVGDPAPAVKVASWAQGEAVREFEGDKVYVIEFWATWCGPCIAAIPHVNELYQRHKDKGLVVIGQNLGEDANTVAGFVKKMGSKMTYRVTVDDQGAMGKNWLKAAGQNGIPCAFVVNKHGKIAYIGHPMSLEESLLEKLLAEPSTKAAGPAGPAADTASAPSAKAVELATRAQNELRAGKLAEAEGSIAQLHEELSGNFGYIGGLMELDLLLAKKLPEDALELSKLLCEDYAKNPAVLAGVASHLISQPDPSEELRMAAGRIVAPFASTAGEAQSSALSTQARIAFLNGDKGKAVEFQTKAVSTASKAEEAAAKAALESYR